jgi:hypothetical protein
MRIQCLFACLMVYLLAADRFWPIGFVTGILPALVVFEVTRRCVQSVRAFDAFVEDFVRRRS